MNAERLAATVKLRYGGVYELTLDGRQKAFDRTKYVIYQIKLADLNKMVMVPAFKPK